MTNDQSEIRLLRADPDLLTHTTSIVVALAGNGTMRLQDVATTIQSVHAALLATISPEPIVLPEQLTPAVSVRKSVTPDYIICLENGLKFKSLKRHLTALGMTPDEYRAKWNLPADYPMVAPNYSATRSNLAKANGLGRKVA